VGRLGGGECGEGVRSGGGSSRKQAVLKGFPEGYEVP